MKRLLYVLSAAFLMMSGISVYGEDLQNQTDEAGLIEDYPGIDSAAIVTSDYHVARGSLLFEAVMLMMTEDDRDPEIEIVSNCASSAPNKYYTDDYIRGWEMYNLLQLTGDRDLAMQYVLDRENFPRPVLDGQTEDDEAA